jgi:hypothetical protein
VLKNTASWRAAQLPSMARRLELALVLAFASAACTSTTAGEGATDGSTMAPDVQTAAEGAGACALRADSVSSAGYATRSRLTKVADRAQIAAST